MLLICFQFVNLLIWSVQNSQNYVVILLLYILVFCFEQVCFNDLHRALLTKNYCLLNIRIIDVLASPCQSGIKADYRQ